MGNVNSMFHKNNKLRFVFGSKDISFFKLFDFLTQRLNRLEDEEKQKYIRLIQFKVRIC